MATVKTASYWDQRQSSQKKGLGPRFRRRGAGARAIRRAVCESVEPRLLLTATLRSHIPASIAPTSAAQAVLAPGVNAYSITATSTTTPTVAAYRFVLNNATAGQATQFSTNGSFNQDAAIALYDASGNQLVLQDADLGGNDATESFATALQSGQQYTVEFFALETNVFGFGNVSLIINTGAQASHPLTLNPSTGSVSLTTSSAPDAFTASSNVRYFPLDLLDANSSASVQISPTGPDTAVDAMLYEQPAGASNWNVISGTTLAAGATSATLAVAPPSGSDINDGTYVLAVAPLNFTAAPEPIAISVTTSSFLAPTTANPASINGTATEEISTVGKVSALVSGTMTNAASLLYSIEAPVSGPMTITYTPSGYPPMLSVYGPGGSTLLAAAASQTAGSPLTTTITASAGSIYYLRAAVDGTSGSGTFTLATSQTYTSTALSATSTAGKQTGLSLAPTLGAQFFTISAPAGSQYLALQLAPDSGSTLVGQLTITGTNGVPATYTATGAGQPLTAIINQSTNPGPYDLMAQGLSGTGTATLYYASLAPASQIPVNQLPSASLNLATGTLLSGSLALATGQLTGLQFYEPSNNAGGITTYSLQTSGGAAGLLLHYVQVGNVLDLDESALSNSSGAASFTDTAQTLELHGIAVLPVNFNGIGTAQLSVSGPLPIGIGVAMVPNQLPGQSLPPGVTPQSTFTVGGAALTTASQVDLYTTQLPYNLTSTSTTLTFTPSDANGPLQANVLITNGSNATLASGTSAAGQPLSLTLSSITDGETLHITVTPASTNLGTGGYLLSMTVNTTNTSQYLVTEPGFFPYASNQTAGDDYLPNNITITSIPFGSFATGDFTSSVPYSSNGTGSIQMFQVPHGEIPAATPFEVYTTDTDPNVNTNIALFMATTLSGGLTEYIPLPYTAPSFDYYPADRSTVDAQVVINNTDLVPESLYGGEIEYLPVTIYVVVMNEQGTQGNYKVWATAVPSSGNAGPGSTTGAADLVVSADYNSSQYLTGQTTAVTANGQTFRLLTPQDMTTSSNLSLVIDTNDGSSGETITASIGEVGKFATIFLYNASGVVSGGKLTLSLSEMAPSGTYSVGISSATFPAAGLTMSVSAPRTYTSPSPVYFPSSVPQDGSLNTNIGRLDPSPTGSFSASAKATSNGAFTRAFSVATEGTVALHMTYPAGATNVVVALYQCGQESQTGNYENPEDETVGVLLDYTNKTDSNGQYSITDYLAPGTYFVIASGTITILFPNLKSISISGNVPAFASQQLAAEPSTGLTPVSMQSIINQGAYAPNVDGGLYDNQFVDNRYETEFFETTIPGNVDGAAGQFQFTIADNDTDTTGTTATGIGDISLTIWSLSNGVYTELSSQLDAIDDHDSPNSDVFTISANDTPVAGEQYFIGVDLNSYENPAYVGISYPVFSSGLPDLVAEPITISPDSGKTLVQTSIRNASYAPSPATDYFFGFGLVDATRLLPALEPFENVPLQQTFVPDSLGDAAGLSVDPGDTVAELSKTNNTQQLDLDTVDPTAPAATISLTNGNMTAEGSAAASIGGGTWGRYIAGAKGQTVTVEVIGSDADYNLFQVFLNGPLGSNSFPVFGTYFLKPAGSQVPFSSQTLDVTTDFGALKATSASNPNQITFYAVDTFGLSTPVYVQSLDVVAAPSMLTGGVPAATATGAGGSITFDNTTYTFTYTFTDNLINDNDDVDHLVGTDDVNNPLPLIGTLPDQFLVAINGNGTSGLNPAENIAFTISGHILLEVAGVKIFDKTYTGASAGNVTFNAQMLLDGATLGMVPGSESLSLQLSKQQIFNDESPVIPIFSVGLPGVIGLDLGAKLGLSAALSAGVKLGPMQGSQGDSFIDSLGIMSPTFIEPSITGTASIVGQVKFAGFDLATITGSAGLTLSVTVGLDNADPNAVFSFDDALDNLAYDVDVSLTVGIAIKVPIIGNIYSASDTENLGNIVNDVQHGIFLTDPPSTATGKFIPAGGDNPDSITTDTSSLITTTISGTSLVGPYAMDPAPQLVINNTTANGLALSVELTNVGTATAPLANLAVATRIAGTWSALSTLTESDDVSDPVLALTNDGNGTGGTPGVVVYDADNVAGSPADQTVNQRLDAEDIRYRYYNGSSWGPEISLTNDSLNDSDQSDAFNSTGAGVLAYVHNTDSAPVNSSGTFDSDSNEIEASLWNPTTHTFGAPVALTTGGSVGDASPATFVDSNGRSYIIWIRTSSSGSQLMYSLNSGSGWSAPAALSFGGLPTGGTFDNVALGSDGAGRVDVLFAYTINNPDGSLSTTLFNRPTTFANFTASASVVQLATNSNFSGLRTTNSPTGALVAYWEQSDGQINQIFETTLNDGAFTAPIQITDDPNLAMEPSAAVDSTGTLQVLYDNDLLPGGTSQGNPTDPTFGAPTASGIAASSIADLPQLTFTTGLSFPDPYQSVATTGTQVTATAVIANRGLASASVTISAYDGLPGTGTLVGTESITLLAGASYNVSQLFTVIAGQQTYSLQLTTSSGQAFDTTENVSSTTVTGLVDIQAVSLTNAAQSPAPGSSNTLTAEVENLSGASIGSFVVTLYSGDPETPQDTATALSSQTVTGLSADQIDYLSFPITLPAGAGDDLYTVVADSSGLIAESDEGNNEARYDVDFDADPAIQTTTGSPVTATLLNSSTANNVQVTVDVQNDGTVPMTNVPVDLQVSRNGGAYTSDGQMIIAELDAGASTTEIFTITALAGQNIFVASIDPSAYSQDSDLSNDIGSATLNVTGLPALTATVSLSNNSAAAGAPLTLTATVTNNGLADATNVPLEVLASLSSGGPAFTIGTGSVSVIGLGAQSVSITLNTAGLAAGTYVLTLEIDPGQTIQQSALPVDPTTDLTIVAAPTVTLINNGSSTSNATQSLSFTTTVSGGVPNGETVSLEDTSNANLVIATATLSGGQATFTVPAGTIFAGVHNLIATYPGDANFAASQSTALAQTVQVVVTSVKINGNIAALVGAQRSMVDSIVYTFSEPVNIAATGAFAIAAFSGKPGVAPTLSWNALNPPIGGASTQWVVTFSGAGVVNGSIANGVYNITMNAPEITSNANVGITAAASRTDTFYRLFADVLGAQTVDAADFVLLSNCFGETAASPSYVAALNLYGTATIDAADFVGLSNDFGVVYSGFTPTI